MKAATYVPEKPCKRGHLLRYVAGTHMCVECNRLHNAAQNREQKIIRMREWYAKKGAAARRNWRLKNAEREKATRRIYQAKNKNKISTQVRARRLRKPETFRQYKKTQYAKHREQILAKRKEWGAANKERIAELNRRWRLANPDRDRALGNRKRARKLHATPPWLTDADHDRIFAIYAEAQKMTRESGVEHQVDHIVPLQGRNVCGLHIPENLRVVPAVVNFKKNNQFIEELCA